MFLSSLVKAPQTHRLSSLPKRLFQLAHSPFGLWRSFVFSSIFFQSALVDVPKLNGGALTPGIVYIASETYWALDANRPALPKCVPPPSLFPNLTSDFFIFKPQVPAAGEPASRCRGAAPAVLARLFECLCTPCICLLQALTCTL